MRVRSCCAAAGGAPACTGRRHLRPGSRWIPGALPAQALSERLGSERSGLLPSFCGALSHAQILAIRLSRLLQLPGAPVVQIRGLDHRAVEVQPIAEELRHRLGAVDADVRLL